MWAWAWLSALVLESELRSWSFWRKCPTPLGSQILNEHTHARGCCWVPFLPGRETPDSFHSTWKWLRLAYSLTPPSPPITASLSFQSSCPCYFKCLLHSGPNPYNNFSKRKDVQKEENETHRTTLNSKAIRNYPLSIWVAINFRSRNYPRRPLRHLLDHSIFLSYQTFHKEKSFLLEKTVYIFFFLKKIQSLSRKNIIFSGVREYPKYC